MRILYVAKFICSLQNTCNATQTVNGCLFISTIYFFSFAYLNIYRSCEGYVFTGVCVHGGGGGAWSREVCSGGGCLLRGVSAPGGVGIPACTPPGETATAADGTHPTGMHSCFFSLLAKIYLFVGPVDMVLTLRINKQNHCIKYLQPS